MIKMTSHTEVMACWITFYRSIHWSRKIKVGTLTLVNFALSAWIILLSGTRNRNEKSNTGHLRADIIKCWKIFHAHCHLSPEMLWDLNVDGRTRGHTYKLRVCHGQVDARTRFFTQSGARLEQPPRMVSNRSLFIAIQKRINWCTRK